MSQRSDRTDERITAAEAGELYAEFGDDLLRTVRRRVNTSPQIVEDACSIAWVQLLRNRPRRITLHGWLVTVARREAIRLDGAARRVEPLAIGPAQPGEHPEPADRVDALGLALELGEAKDRLATLPERKRRLHFLHALGYTYREVGTITGDSERTVDRQLRRARKRLHSAQ